jgi:hypothetical protein
VNLNNELESVGNRHNECFVGTEFSIPRNSLECVQRLFIRYIVLSSN